MSLRKHTSGVGGGLQGLHFKIAFFFVYYLREKFAVKGTYLSSINILYSHELQLQKYIIILPFFKTLAVYISTALALLYVLQ